MPNSLEVYFRPLDENGKLFNNCQRFDEIFERIVGFSAWPIFCFYGQEEEVPCDSNTRALRNLNP